MLNIINNLNHIRQRIRNAEEKYGRLPHSVRLLAVSKTQTLDQITQCFAAGQQCFGENYVQEALLKISALSLKGLEWHFIGAIQSNKTAVLAEHFSWIHTISRLKEAQLLSDYRKEQPSLLNICVQVNWDNNPNKAGVNASEVPLLVESIRKLPGLQLRGLMTLPPQDKDPTLFFQYTHDLFEKLKTDDLLWDTLSMGMTHDLEAAIEQGATMVRIGTGIFGERKSLKTKDRK